MSLSLSPPFCDLPVQEFSVLDCSFIAPVAAVAKAKETSDLDSHHHAVKPLVAYAWPYPPLLILGGKRSVTNIRERDRSPVTFSTVTIINWIAKLCRYINTWSFPVGLARHSTGLG